MTLIYHHLIPCSKTQLEEISSKHLWYDAFGLEKGSGWVVIAKDIGGKLFLK